MMTMIDKLFSLLRSALWGYDFQDKVSKEEFEEVMNLAKEQTVYGLAFDALSQQAVKGQYDKRQLLKAYAKAEKIKRQNEKINKELISFARRSQDVGLQCLVVKGQLIGCLYANPMVRTSGDIDFLVPNISSKLSDAFPNVQFPEVMKEKELGFKHNGIVYELHSRLIDFGCKRHQEIWEGLIAEEWKKDCYVEVSGEKVKTLSPTMNAVYLFVHLYFHLIREGVSLRQFCDWAVMLHHYKDEIDRKQLNEIFSQLDMVRGYKAFGCILVDELGLQEEEFPMLLTDDDRQWKKKILHDIFLGGNFGKRNHKAKSALGFKLETCRIIVRNSIRYYGLAPSEMRMMIPKVIKINMKLLF